MGDSLADGHYTIDMQIDRCYCYQKSFADLKEVAEATGSDSVSALQEHVTFGENCQLCHPYVRRMLTTGQTTFSEIIEPNEDRAGNEGAGDST